MSTSFRPANSFTDRHGLFVAVAGGTNAGKTFSALRLARGIAGPKGKVAVLDTEGGRTLHLKSEFEFDVSLLDPPHRPERYADAARDAEAGGYDVLVIDSFSQEWCGLGGVLDYQSAEFERMGSREAVKLASWIKPKMSHKAMVYSFLQRRMPIVFSLRAEEKAKKVGSDVKSEWGPICNKAFPFEVTVSFMLMQDRQGIIDLSRPHKMEGAHRGLFRDGDQLSEEHGAKLAAWARGELGAPSTERTAETTAARTKASPDAFWSRDDYRIPAKPTEDGKATDWQAWEGRVHRAAKEAPDPERLDKLEQDNASLMDGFAKTNERAADLLREHIVSCRDAFKQGALV